MPQPQVHGLTLQDLAGRWLAVEQQSQAQGISELDSPLYGAVLVDYDSELDLLCQRVAAAGLTRLTIFKYEGQSIGNEDYSRGPRGSA